MLTRFSAMILLLLLAMVMVWSPAAPALEEHHGIFVGTVMKLDAGAKTVVVKLADEASIRFTSSSERPYMARKTVPMPPRIPSMD